MKFLLKSSLVSTSLRSLSYGFAKADSAIGHLYFAKKLNTFHVMAKRHYRFTPTMASNDFSSIEPSQPFQARKALVLTKFSRLEFEKRRHPEWSEKELVKNLERRGSDYNALLMHDGIHSKNKEYVIRTLEANRLELKVVNRFDYTNENINWADVIFTIGGDGTFLMAASKVISSDKPVIGINSDPSRSVGYLCLPVSCTEHFEEALTKLKKGKFKWQFRQRIRITLEGETAADDPIELHDQQLEHPEYRYLDLEMRNPDGTIEYQNINSLKNGCVKRLTLPVRALNEVFVGEALSSRVSYYEFAVDNGARHKLKSSGITICTGTGSTSWSFNINKLTPQCVQHLFSLIKEETGTNLPNNSKTIQKITDRFNNSLIFDPSRPTMAYTLRDPVVFGTNFDSNPRGFAKAIEVKSRMFDASVVIDGGLSYKFNDGSKAIFEIFEEDALRTIKLDE